MYIVYCPIRDADMQGKVWLRAAHSVSKRAFFGSRRQKLVIRIQRSNYFSRIRGIFTVNIVCLYWHFFSFKAKTHKS